MGLRAKTILILAATICLAAFALVGTSQLFSNKYIEGIEIQEAEEGLRRAEALVADDVAQLDVIVRDWAFWDDTWEYVESRSRVYEDSNLGQDESVLLLDLSALVILDGEGEIVFGTAVDPGHLPELEAAFAGKAPPEAEGFTGILRVGTSLHLVAARPILRSDQSGPARGTFAMSRLIDQERLERYTKLSGLPVDLRALPYGEEAAAAGDGPDLEISARAIAASAGLKDIRGASVARIGVETARASARYGGSMRFYFMAAVLVLVVVIGIVAVFMFEAAVLGRMRALGSELERIAANKLAGTRLTVTGGDELTALQRTMNATLDALYDMIGERDAALREIHHRVKNNLQVVASLLSLQADSAGTGSAADALIESRRRVLAMSFVLEELYAEKALQQVDAGRLFSRLAVSSGQSFDRDGKIRARIECGELRLGVDIAFPVGLIVGEAISNSYRHAFAGRAEGSVEIAAETSPHGALMLSVRDDGIGVDAAAPKGLGLELIKILSQQIKADYHLEGTPGGGSEFVLVVPPPGDSASS